MKETALFSIIKEFSIAQIEKHLIYNFIEENNIDYSLSNYLSSYLNEIQLDNKLLSYVREMHHDKIEELVIDMEILIPSEDRKTNGAFFTPQYIVDFIISNLEPTIDSKVIDPSCGSGAFLLGLIRYYRRKFNKSINEIVCNNIFGADILEYNTRRAKLLIVLYALLCGEVVDESDLHIYTADSLRCGWSTQFDAVVGNPPYVKFQDLDDNTRNYLYETFSTTKLGTYNLYFAFFELGLNLLNENGKLGYITPNNYFTSLSGEPLRKYFQSNKSIFKIIDFDATKVFDVQTYTAITFLNKKKNDTILYDRIERNETVSQFLSEITLTPNKYVDLSPKKWRLLCGDERKNIKAIENSGQALGTLLNICVGIATLKDDVYFIDPIGDEGDYYKFRKNNKLYKIEKNITKPLVKISDMKKEDDVLSNSRRIIFPYVTKNGKAVPLEEEVICIKYPYCYEYLLSVRPILESRGKGKHTYSPFYMYGRSQGLNRFGARIYTPTFSLKPRFLYDEEETGFFTNGYGLYFIEQENSFFTNPVVKKENVDVLLKILNSIVMDYYVTKTSVAIEGGYPCYQKNFIERFTIPYMSNEMIDELRCKDRQDDINQFVCDLYHINLPSPNLSL